jgi:hypothetical protein
MPAAWACIDCEGRAYSAGDDRRLVVVSPGGELEPFGSNEQWHQPIFSIGCAPRGGLVAASAGGEWARVVRRGDDGVWRTAASRYLGRRGPDEYRAVQTSFVWLKGATEGDWRIVAGTTRGVVELAFAGDRIDLIEEHLLDRSIVAHLAASPDEQFLAVDLGGDGLRLLGRREDSWEERAGIPFTLPILHLAFARDDRLLVTSARSVRIFDRDMELVAQIPCVDAAGFVSAHAHPGGDRVITVAANQVMREWWLDDRGVLAAAEQRIGSEERRRQAPHRGLVRQR